MKIVRVMKNGHSVAIVLPRAERQALHVGVGDYLEMRIRNHAMVLTKYSPSAVNTLFGPEPEPAGSSRQKGSPRR